MNDPSESEQSGRSSEKNPHADDTDLEKLRSLLLKPEQEDIRDLQHRLDDPKHHAREIGRDLPQAIILRSNQDDRLKTALMPTIEGVVKASVKKDYKIFADALSPVIGPAIRRAISETFKNMIQSINKTLEQSFSWQGIKWRFEALRSGKSFAEIVLYHTLLYRVEQVFLVHKESGLLLQHVLPESLVFQDADMVSGMLKAIQDFVHDSFTTRQGELLDTLKFGELTVWIEQTPQLLLASVIRGVAPENLRSVFQDTCENIQLEKYEALESFKGDTSVFDSVKDLLEDCLLAQYKVKKRKFSPLFWILLAVFIAAAGYWFYSSVKNHQKWKTFFSKLQDTPGIVVSSIRKESGQYHVTGLIDPLANLPLDVLKQQNLDAHKVHFQFEPYYSLYPEFLLKRVEKILNPPHSINFWLSADTLFVQGDAPLEWIEQTRAKVKMLPWPLDYKEENIVPSERLDLDEIRQRVNNQFIYFDSNSSKINSDHETKLKEITNDLKNVLHLAQLYDKTVHIQVLGFADSYGSDTINVRLSQARADNVAEYLIGLGIEDKSVSSKGLGESEPQNKTKSADAEGSNRCVTFFVTISD